MEIQIRKCKRGDAAKISELMSALGYQSTASQMEARLKALTEDAAHMTFVATANNRIVGMTGACVGHIYEQNQPLGRIIALIVDEETRGSGIGSALVQTAEDWIISQGATTILVNSGTERIDAHKFYENLGYSKKGFSFVRRAPTSTSD